MGDPECQVILPILKTDIIKIFNNKVVELCDTKIEWKKEKSIQLFYV